MSHFLPDVEVRLKRKKSQEGLFGKRMGPRQQGEFNKENNVNVRKYHEENSTRLSRENTRLIRMPVMSVPGWLRQGNVEFKTRLVLNIVRLYFKRQMNNLSLLPLSFYLPPLSPFLSLPPSLSSFFLSVFWLSSQL